VRRLCAAVLGAVVIGLAGCGVPTGGEPTTIPPSEVPYGLASPRTGATDAPSAEPVLDPSGIFLVADDGRLVARGREVAGSTRRDRLDDLLVMLAEGPTTAELDEQLSTALPPEVRLTVADLAAGTATVDIEVPAEAPTGWASRRAAAQIVLTVTSVPGVTAVLLTLTGEPVEAPLPSGELTSEPLTAADYAPFLTGAGGSPAVTPAPPSAGAPPSATLPPAATGSPSVTLPESPQTPPPR
jgi:hypothetical protein